MDDQTVLPPPSLLLRWHLDDPRVLSHRANTHWRVTSPHGPAVLRRYGADVTEHDIDYEQRFSEHLAAARWPVPQLLAPPIHSHDHWWALFALLPGEQRNGPGEDRRRGRLLAELHATTGTFPVLQRASMPDVRDVIFDPRLGDALRFVERHFPRQGRILLWHYERAIQRFDDVTGTAPKTTIHGDFNSRNLLFVGDRLTAILDFEGSHFDHRVAEFALAWRGNRDDVVLGYDDVSRLSETDWHLLTPCMWAWAFYGVASDVERMQRGEIAPLGFDWQVDMVLRRSPLMGRDAVAYRHDDP